MAVELCSSFIPPSEETAASEKLIRLFSSSPAEKEANKFKKVLSILGRSRTGHARFRRAPATGYTKIHSPTPIRQIPPPNFKPPLSSFKRKCASSETGVSGECSGCHCSKRRKLKVKRVVMVPAISMKMAEIPPDDYSWRKYGQKPIKGSPYPRGYYKCSSVRGCLARKHVERDVEDPIMLVVTYEGDHSHSISIDETPSTMILESC